MRSTKSLKFGHREVKLEVVNCLLFSMSLNEPLDPNTQRIVFEIQKNKVLSNNVLKTATQITNLFTSYTHAKCDITSWYVTEPGASNPVAAGSTIYNALRLASQAGQSGVLEMLIDTTVSTLATVEISFDLHIYLGTDLYKQLNPALAPILIKLSCVEETFGSLFDSVGANSASEYLSS